jgi:hypothetical protein
MLDSNEPYCGLGNIENLTDYMENLLADEIVVPNSMLPESYHDNTRGGRTLAKVNSIYNERHGNKKKVTSDIEAETRADTLAFYNNYDNILNERSRWGD